MKRKYKNRKGGINKKGNGINGKQGSGTFWVRS
jgi:hypothetical protein